MIQSSLIEGKYTRDWEDRLQRCGDHDIYHLPQYHLLAEKNGEGKPFLFFFQSNDGCAALPFLLRPVAEVDGLKSTQFNDISSVYGYPGIITSMKRDDKNASAFREEFQIELLKIFKKLKVVTFFSRTNPLFSNEWLLDNFMEIISLSKTVAIDLSFSDKTQLSQMTKGHKYDIRKARKNGVVVSEDPEFKAIDSFFQLYNETMKRNNASEHYYFTKDYYSLLKQYFGKSIKLYYAKVEDRIISAALFFLHKGIIQYHLSGGLREFFHLNGAKLILDEVRQQGSQDGFKWLHLGGGVGSSGDNLFRFKAGFSKVRLPFQINRKVTNQDAYTDLCKKRRTWAALTKQNLSENEFFPDYRKPLIRKEDD